VNLLLLLFAPVLNQLATINRKLDQLMAAVQIQQEELDQFASDIQESVDAVAAELQALIDSADNPLTAADVTALQGAIDNLKALEAPHPDQTLPGDLPPDE
jgi:hypothetical protein